MNEVHDHLDKLFGVVEEEPKAVVEKKEPVEKADTAVVVKEATEVIPYEETPDESHDLEYDYELSRETHRDLIDQGKGALEKLLKVADESQHPRAYEVAGQLLKNLSDMTDKLMNLHEKRKKIENDGKPKTAGSVTVDKAVFIGTTSELLKEIKHVKNEFNE